MKDEIYYLNRAYGRLIELEQEASDGPGTELNETLRGCIPYLICRLDHAVNGWDASLSFNSSLGASIQAQLQPELDLAKLIVGETEG